MGLKRNQLFVFPFSILFGCLILGGFYYASQVNKQKSIEKQQQIEIEQKKEDELNQEIKEQSRKKDLDDCMYSAQKSYSYAWYEECKQLGLLTNNCIDIKELSFDDYLIKYNISMEEYKEQREIVSDNQFAARADYMTRVDCSLCRLPFETASHINDVLDKAKNECFKKYPQK